MRGLLTTCAELAGGAVLCVGVSLWSLPASLVCAGLLLIVGGVAAG